MIEDTDWSTQDAWLVRTTTLSYNHHVAHDLRFSLMTSLLNWMGETPAQKSTASTPGYLSFGMAGEEVLVTPTIDHVC